MDRKSAEYGIIDYAKDNNSSFSTKPFDETDGAIFSQLAYLDYTDNDIRRIQKGEIKTISDLKTTEAYKEGSDSKIKKLIDNCSKSNRYKDIGVSDVVVDPVSKGTAGYDSISTDQEQFGAVTFSYNENGKTVRYMSFRGTNGTDEGWGEDFEMLVRETQADDDATTYMNYIGRKYPDDILDYGGHSKGGELGEHAALNCDPDVAERLRAAYLYDSPGKRKDLIAKYGSRYDDFMKTVERGAHICPSDSFIGQILEEPGLAEYVKSSEAGFNAHDLYSWEINRDGSGFTRKPQSEISKAFNELTDCFANKLDENGRNITYALAIIALYSDDGEAIEPIGENVVDLAKTFVSSSQIGTILTGIPYFGLLIGTAAVTIKMLDNYLNLSPEDRARVNEAVVLLISSVILEGARCIEEIEKFLTKVKNNIDSFIDSLVKAGYKRVNDIRRNYYNIYNGVYQNVMNFCQQVFGHGGGYEYNAGSVIRVNTAALRDYANRLKAVNRRINSIDRRMDSLYLRVGLVDLLNLLQADLLTQYSFRLDSCSNYLLTTAQEFENAENEINRYL